MPVICAAIGCNNKFVKGSEIRFYRFPLSKRQLANKWVHSLGMKNFTPTANTCLCSEHFRADCFRDYNGKQFLREDAVPTIFAQGQDTQSKPKKWSSVKFHHIPTTNEDRMKRWLSVLDIDPNTPVETVGKMFVCSDHFLPEDYGKPRRGMPGVYLNNTAVPSVYITEKADIELRKRAVIQKEVNPPNPMGSPADRDRAKEAVAPRREKRGGMRGGRGGRGAKQMGDRQNTGPKSRVYNNKGCLLSNNMDMCDCLDVDCMGCFYPCLECGSRKCGVECRCDRKWLYEQVEVEGGEIIRNKFAVL